MLLNFILLVIVIAAFVALYLQLKYTDKREIKKISTCDFVITKPKYVINFPIRIAKYSIKIKSKDRYFRDFPIGFKFYSDEKFRSKIKITYTIANQDEKEIIYDKVVEFEDNVKEHIYYINDVIVGSINIEIFTESQYGKPTIKFELLQGSNCHLSKEHTLEINFPK